MEVKFSQYTDCGGRKNNEDSIGIGDGIYIVADGLGGHSYGEIASSKVVEFLIQNYQGLEDFQDEKMKEIIKNTNNYLCDLKREKPFYENMATTVVSAFIKEEKFNYLNVGDSRMYYFRKNKIYRQSKDHSMTQIAVDMGEIKKKQMRFDENRNRLTKVLGTNPELKVSDKFEAFQMMRGDAFLLCTDGFWEYISEWKMRWFLMISKTPEDWMNKMVTEIGKKVVGENDNLSAICGMIC